MIIKGAQIHGGVYQDQTPYVTTGLVQYMDAQDYSGSGTTWPARTGLAGTLYNAPTWTSAGPGYFTFDPASLQYALFPNIGDLGNWTVECWFNLTASLDTAENTAAVTTVYDGTGQINYTLSSWSGSAYAPYMTAGYFNGSWFYTSGAIPTVGTWYQMVGTFDGTTLSAYWNGALYNQNNPPGPTAANGGSIRVARRWDGPESSIHYFPGRIALVRIYDTDIGSSGVAQNWNANKERFGL